MVGAMMSPNQMLDELESEEQEYIINDDFIDAKLVEREWSLKHFPINLNEYVGYCTGDRVLIIKGKLVTPKPKEVVTKYEVE